MSHIRDEIESPDGYHVLDPLAGWVTLAAVVAILLVAFFPFNFSVGATAYRRVGFFFNWFTLVAKGWKGWLLNILFFFPFGAGWAWWTRATNRRRLGSWAGAGLAGLILSFTIEWLQLFVPVRDSSWDDVVMNTLGMLIGWLIFRSIGAACLRYVDRAMNDLSSALER